MYLIHEDHELAAQAFSRSQANDPENAVAWLGQAVLAVRSKDLIEAHELYQHAFEIGERSFVSLLFKRCLSRLLQVTILQRLPLTKRPHTRSHILHSHQLLYMH
jgi:hypothetical protein